LINFWPFLDEKVSTFDSSAAGAYWQAREMVEKDGYQAHDLSFPPQPMISYEELVKRINTHRDTLIEDEMVFTAQKEMC
jgi:hypothetical protein